jgi:hypothetical protein
MAKLTSRQFWLSEKLENIGDLYGTIRTLEIGDSKHGLIYYKSGINEIDKTLNNYIELGYVNEMFFHENAIVFYLNKYGVRYLEDELIFILKRENIISVNEIELNCVEVADFEQTKHIAKAVGRRAFGLIGSIIGLATENIATKRKIITVPGVIFEINYLDDKNDEKQIKYYCEKEIYSKVGEYFLSFIKKNLPEELKVPIKLL